MEGNETVNQGNATKEPEKQAQQENKTFTQDELNAIVNDRLKREKEKYSDYATLKSKADELDKLQEASKTELQKATDKAAALQKELDELKQAESVRGIREKVAKETGVPVNLISGSTEEDCKAQADAIKAYANPGYPDVKDGGEAKGTPGASTAQQFADWFNQQ